MASTKKQPTSQLENNPKASYRAPDALARAERFATGKADFSVQYAGSNSEHINRRDNGLQPRAVYPQMEPSQSVAAIRPGETQAKENWQTLPERELILEKNRSPFQELFMQQLA